MNKDNNSYRFDIMTLSNGKKKLIVIMDDPSRYLISTFLMSDLQGRDPQYALEAIDSVLSGEINYAELNGNVCGLEIHKEDTEIYDNLAEDGKGEWCTIKTKSLRELIVTWYDKKQEFAAKQN